jgi:hypothetical protein
MNGQRNCHDCYTVSFVMTVMTWQWVMGGRIALAWCMGSEWEDPAILLARSGMVFQINLETNQLDRLYHRLYHRLRDRLRDRLRQVARQVAHRLRDRLRTLHDHGPSVKSATCHDRLYTTLPLQTPYPPLPTDGASALPQAAAAGCFGSPRPSSSHCSGEGVWSARV